MSIWWVVGAFVLGGYAGMLMFALMSMAARESEQAVKAKEAVERDGLGPANLEAHLA
ncbi:MAG: hypothetical protein M3R31_08420 [Pseudomonadota bacterium]|nr:hypothetical protein [Pseudomonadota bacterium]